MDNQPVTVSDRVSGLLSRKFVVAMTALVLVTFAIPVDGVAKLDFMRWIVGFFLGANVVQKGVLDVLGKK